MKKFIGAVLIAQLLLNAYFYLRIETNSADCMEYWSKTWQLEKNFNPRTLQNDLEYNFSKEIKALEKRCNKFAAYVGQAVSEDVSEYINGTLLKSLREREIASSNPS